MNPKHYFKPDNRTEFHKRAHIKKKDISPDLLLMFMKEIKKSFDFTCENCTDWNLCCEDQEEYIILGLSCKADRRQK